MRTHTCTHTSFRDWFRSTKSSSCKTPKFSSRISYYIIFFLKSSQCNETYVFRTQQSTPKQSCTNLKYRDWFWLRKHPCFCSLSWTDLLEQPRYRTAQIITKRKKKTKTKQQTTKQNPNKQNPNHQQKNPTCHRARESNEEEKCTLSMPFLLFSFFLPALSSLLFWQEYVMLFFILFFF